MTEQGSGGDRIGSLSVDIIADLTPLEGAKGRVADALASFPQEVRIKVNASELRSVEAAAKAVSSALAHVHKTAADAPSGTKLKFAVDTAKIRTDIEAAFREPFKIKIEIGNLSEIRQQIGDAIPITVQHHGGVAGVMHNAAPEQAHVAPRPTSSVVRTDIESNPDLRKAIHNLYNDLDRHLQIAGKQSLGPATDDPTVKFGRMVDRFGTHLDDFITVQKERATGGGLSKQALMAQGISAPNAATLRDIAKEFHEVAKKSPLFSHARETSEATASPVVATTIRQAEAHAAGTATAALREIIPATVKQATAAARAAGFDMSTLLGRTQAAAAGRGPLLSGPPGALPLQNDLSTTLQQFIEGERTRRTGTSSPYRTTENVDLPYATPNIRMSRRGSRPPRGNTTYVAGGDLISGEGAPEPEQEAASARLQPNRRLTSLLTVQRPGGSVIDMSGLARAAQLGTFARLGRETGGQKRMVELSAEDLEAFERITKAGRKVSGQRATIGGREIEKVNPFEEFVRQAEALYGPEARVGIEGNPTIKQQISQYLGAGQRLALPNEGITYRLSGETGRNTMYGSGLGRGGTGFSGDLDAEPGDPSFWRGSVGRSRAERLRQATMAAQRVSNPKYLSTLRAASAANNALSQQRIANAPARVEREFDEASRNADTRRRIESGELPSPQLILDEIQRRVQSQTAGGESIGGLGGTKGGKDASGKEPGASLGGTSAGRVAVRQSWTDIIGEISQAFGLGINTSQPPKKIRSQLQQAGLGYLNDTMSAAYGEISTRELYANQDIRRMRDQGQGDILGERTRTTVMTPEGELRSKSITMPSAPITPAQLRSRELRAQMSSVAPDGYPSSNYTTTAVGSDPKSGSAEISYGARPGVRLPYPVPSLRMLSNQATPEAVAAAAEQRMNLAKRADAELDKTRQALGFVSSITGAEFEEMPATPTRKRRGMGLRPESPNRPDPFFRLRNTPDFEPRGDRKEVLAALEPGALAAREADLRAKLKASLSGDQSGPDTTGIQRDLEATIQAKNPDVQAEIRSMFQNRTIRGLLAPARRSSRAGATGQQMRERFAETGMPWMPDVLGTHAAVPYSFNAPVPSGSATAAGGGGGGGGGPTISGGGRAGGGSVIDVNIVQAIPLTIAGAASGSASGSMQPGTSGIGGVGIQYPMTMYPQSRVTPGQAGPAGGGGRRGRGTAASPTPPSSNQTGKLDIQRPPTTGPLPESMRIRMVPRVAVSAEQRKIEREAEQANRPATTRSTMRRVSSAELAELGIPVPASYDAPRRLTAGLNPFVAQARAAARQASASLPQRAISTSMVQIAENIFGGRSAPLARLANLQNRIGDVDALAARGDEFRGQRGDINIARRAANQSINALTLSGQPVPEKLTQAAKQLTGQLVDLHAASKKNTQDLKEASAEVTTLAKSAVTGGDVLRNLAAGAVGGVVGGLAAGAVAGVGQAAITAGAEALGPLIERMTGFAGTTARVTSALSDATRAANGNVESVVATQAAQVGLSKANYDAIGPMIQQRVAIEAGNKNLSDQVDLLRTAQNIQAGGSSGLLGVLQPSGGIPGLSRATGGFLGSQIGATPSTLETLVNALPGRSPVAGLADSPLASVPLIGPSIGLLNSAIGLGARGETSGQSGKDTLTFFNNQLEKAGSSLKLLANASDDQLVATTKALGAAGASKSDIEAFTNARIAIAGPNGAPATTDQGRQFLYDLNKGSQLPDPELLLQGLKQQIQAQVDGIERDLQQSLQTNQASTAIGLLGTPVTPLGRGLLAANTPASVRATIQGAQGAYDTATSSLLARGDLGTTALDKLKVPNDLRQQLADVGAQMDKLIGDEANRQATNFWVDYDHNVTLAKRNVADLTGLVGQASTTYTDPTSATGTSTVQASNVGQLENQNLGLSRESQVLGFRQQQNQLNLQTALAGFLAPGETGEERYLRKQQAQREVAIQQRQLTIGETVASNQYQITKVINDRALKDAKFQLESLPRNLDMQVKIQLDQQQLAVLDQNRQAVLADVQSYATAGNAFVTATNAQLTALETAGQKYFTKLAGDVEKAFADAFGNDPFHVGTGGTSTGAGPGAAPSTPNQREDRLPSPSLAPVQGGTGSSDTGGPGNVTPANSGGNVIVQINGGNFTDEQSRQRLIRDVSTAVQTSLDRKASLIGLRTPR